MHSSCQQYNSIDNKSIFLKLTARLHADLEILLTRVNKTGGLFFFSESHCLESQQGTEPLPSEILIMVILKIFLSYLIEEQKTKDILTSNIYLRQ
jgi:hypothetical protein